MVRQPDGHGLLYALAQTYCYLDQFVSQRLSDGYFEDAAGREMPRTQFEYIRDHLGYRLKLQRATFPKQVRPGGTLAVRVEVVNRGFSALHNPRPVLFGLIGPDDRVTELPAKEADPRTWQPFAPGDPEFGRLVHRFGAEAELPRDLEAGHHRLGLWMPDASPSLRLDSRYAVRVANRGVPVWTNNRG